jgi:hypothetical protein
MAERGGPPADIDRILLDHVRSMTVQARKSFLREIGVIRTGIPWLLGSREDAPFSVGLIILILTFTAIFLVIWLERDKEMMKTVVVALLGIVTTSVGFLFGRRAG